MEYDLSSDVKVKSVITPTAGDAAGASTVGAIIDTHEDEQFGSLTYVIHAGTITAGAFSVTLEESDEITFGGEETTVPSDDLIGASPTFAASDDNKIARVGVRSKKRFQRLTLVGASSPNGDFAVQAVLGHPKSMPVAAQA